MDEEYEWMHEMMALWKHQLTKNKKYFEQVSWLIWALISLVIKGVW